MAVVTLVFAIQLAKQKRIDEFKIAILFFWYEGKVTYMSSYDDTFDKSQFALYDYDATNNNVKDLFNKYRMFKRNVNEQNKKLGYSGYQFTEKVDNPSYISNMTAKQAEQLIHLKDFIQYCDAIINSNIKELNYYERLIFYRIPTFYFTIYNTFLSLSSSISVI